MPRKQKKENKKKVIIISMNELQIIFFVFGYYFRHSIRNIIFSLICCRNEFLTSN